MSDLTTLANVKAYAGVVGSADDAVLTSLVTSYSEWVRSYCSRDFDVRTYTINRNGRGGNGMLLPQFPVTAVSSVQVDGVSIPAQPKFGTYGYRFDEFGITMDGAIFTLGRSNVTVTFTAGYAVIPTDIAQAVNEMVALRYKLRDKLEWSQKSLAGETVTLNTRDMPASVKTILRQYQQNLPL